MKINRPVFIPAVLAVYLAIMAFIGLEGLRSGQTSLVQYIGTIVITAGIIILLHFHLKKRERLRRERQNDIERNQNSSNNPKE